MFNNLLIEQRVSTERLGVLHPFINRVIGGFFELAQKLKRGKAKAFRSPPGGCSWGHSVISTSAMSAVEKKGWRGNDATFSCVFLF